VGWVFFRSESFSGAVNIIKRMFGLGSTKIEEMLSIYEVFTYERMLTMFLGIVFSFIFVKVYNKETLHIEVKKLQFLYTYAKLVIFASMFLLSIVYVAGSTFNPFIYFRF
jgi:alginate O-acetyltransferase complex protein AlgI